MSTISFIGIHHTGGLGTDNFASTKHLTMDQIDSAHKSRWPDFPSSIKRFNGRPYYCGYNIVLFPDGSHIQCRAFGAETAAQKGHNFDTISICLVGNFMKRADGSSVDSVTPAQQRALQSLLKGILSGSHLGIYVSDPGIKYDLSYSRIHPHRILQPNHTDCYGTYLPDDWARQLALAPDPTPEKPLATPEDVKEVLSIYNQIQLLMARLQDIFAKKRFGKQLESVGARLDRNYCSGMVDAG